MLQISNLKLWYGDQFIFGLDNFNIKRGKSIIVGIIGNNGSGKTSFMKIICGSESTYEGVVKNTFTTEYLGQNYFRNDYIKLSNGQLNKQQIINIFNKNCELLILDEPTVHLDNDSRELLIKSIKNFKGVILLVSHDRDLIRKTVTRILEIEDNKINLFEMNYETYLFEKNNKIKQKELDYFHYKKEKQKLEKNILMRKNNSLKTDRKPNRMSSSDAKLISSFNYQGKKSVDKTIKSLNTKLNKIVAVKPNYKFDKKIHFIYGPDLKQKNIIWIEKYNFTIHKKDRVFICGKNGAGKTTLLDEIESKLTNLNKTNISIGYLRQSMKNYNLNLSVVEYLTKMIDGDINIIRGLLSQFKYSEQTFHKQLKNLSEGEKLQLNISIILSKESNVLLLDEPTNFMDIKSIEMLELAIKQYEGTIIMVSHDNEFIKRVGGRILNI